MQPMIDQSNRAGPSGSPSPDPTMGYMGMDSHAAAAMMAGAGRHDVASPYDSPGAAAHHAAQEAAHHAAHQAAQEAAHHAAYQAAQQSQHDYFHSMENYHK